MAGAAALPPPLEPRVFTFGIGPYCNHYFLKQLAAVGRGLSDAAVRPRHVRPRIERMLAAAAAPLLGDCALVVRVRAVRALLCLGGARALALAGQHFSLPSSP